ncbi:MAG: nucleotidyltransferase family protein [Oscillospiraceae bacterium]|nr:nucleotidyltransferase family protein [Oscillospiraceae bacterium]
MDQGTIPIFFALLRSAICGTKLSESEKSEFKTEQLPAMIAIAKKHDIDNLLAFGLKKNGLMSKTDAGIDNAILKAIYIYEQLNSEYENICKVFEAAGMPFIPLKGSVIRDYYPEAWMRTSSDIDILVSEENSEKAANVLVNECGYVYNKKGSHDISFFTPNKMYVELHYNLVEDGLANESSSVLKSVWKTVHLRNGYNYWYEMPDEMFYFYHIAHMAKHFENGGCGIRPFIDLWILDSISGADRTKRDELLEQGNLLKFADAARNLSKKWFENGEPDNISEQMEKFILQGGVYGSNENRITVQQQKKGGSFKYALSKIFIPYDIIKFHYPILQKHRWLTPIMEVRRWFKLVFCGHAKRTVKELKYNQEISADEAEAAKSFLSNIGL